MSIATTFFGLPTASITNAHIHSGNAISPGGVLVPVGAKEVVSGLIPGITHDQLTAILAGNTYLNIHTTAFSGGELRGQILFENSGGAVLSAKQEVATVASTAGGVGQVQIGTPLADGSAVVTVTVLGHTVTGATNAHIHGPSLPAPATGPSSPCPIVINNAGVPPLTSNFACPTPFTKAQLTDLRNGLYYFNIHSTANTAGEIRGQIIFPSSFDPAFVIASTLAPPTGATSTATGHMLAMAYKVGTALAASGPIQAAIYLTTKGITSTVTSVGAVVSSSTALSMVPVKAQAGFVGQLSSQLQGAFAMPGMGFIEVATSASNAVELRGTVTVTMAPTGPSTAVTSGASAAVASWAALLLVAVTAVAQGM